MYINLEFIFHIGVNQLSATRVFSNVQLILGIRRITHQFLSTTVEPEELVTKTRVRDAATRNAIELGRRPPR